jgi:hypothetical protein
LKQKNFLSRYCIELFSIGMDRRKRTGIEYILQEAQEPNLFVIRKQKREGPEKVTALAAYYVLDGSIYQAPQLYTVIGSRVVRSLYHISNAFLQVATKLEKIGYGEPYFACLHLMSALFTDNVYFRSRAQLFVHLFYYSL